jgi:uncharacterized protein YukE
MARIGADINSMMSLKGTFNTEAGNLRSLVSNLDRAVREVDWQGGAAEKFKGAWETEYRSKIGQLADLLGASADEVQRRIEALQAAGGGA